MNVLFRYVRALLISLVTVCSSSPALAAMPRVLISTSLGDIIVELDQGKAPKTVENFLRYAADGQYDGTIFHRVIKDFMIQGGGLRPDLSANPNRAPIVNEATNGLRNDRGTIAMARTGEPHSATSQFFINTVDNGFLNFPAQDGWGYCVFGKVVSGMEIVDKIRNVPTKTVAPHQNVPQTTVLIKRIELVGTKPQATTTQAPPEGLPQAIEAWRQDWESRDAARYLSHYSKQFRSGEHTLSTWSQQKQAAITNKTWIKIELKSLRVDPIRNKDETFKVSFEQDYRSDSLNNLSRKHQLWTQEDGRWKIIFEGSN